MMKVSCAMLFMEIVTIGMTDFGCIDPRRIWLIMMLNVEMKAGSYWSDIN